MTEFHVFQKQKGYLTIAGAWGAQDWDVCRSQITSDLRSQNNNSQFILCVMKNCRKVLIRNVMWTDFLLLCGEWIIEKQ